MATKKKKKEEEIEVELSPAIENEVEAEVAKQEELNHPSQPVVEMSPIRKGIMKHQQRKTRPRPGVYRPMTPDAIAGVNKVKRRLR